MVCCCLEFQLERETYNHNKYPLTGPNVICNMFFYSVFNVFFNLKA